MWLVGDVLGGPDLAVGMRIAGAHHGAAVLEDLDVAEDGIGAEGAVLVGPGVDDAADVGDCHAREGEAVVGVEAEDAAEAALALGDAGVARGVAGVSARGVGEERRVVVVEDEDACRMRGVLAAGAGVAGTEVAGGVVVDVGEA